MFSWLNETQIPGPVIGMIVILVMMLTFVLLALAFDKLWNK